MSVAADGLIFTEKVIEPVARTFSLVGRLLLHTLGGIAEQRVQTRLRLSRRVRCRYCMGGGARLEITAEIRTRLVLHRLGDRFAATIGHARVIERAQAADMQIRMAGRTRGQPGQRQGFAFERCTAFPANQG